ncbi:MAG: glycosyltransferase [Leptolyngbyaceae cyanobacterium SM1_1_3]|nr:glycosyltransferase [Leptolyngbyaceae cyanobacterium SM1_1_3]NJN01359.1 glycosyltransferase [Leptolyngbyaceae cyanobacterium RM1_1_2]NJO11368.1 glycosyltransferase [Leptolyngbyaceae cyanobacterium SL_1_1]
MRVLHLSTSDLEGGAARGTYWLHQALLRAGVDSQMLVSTKLSHDSTVVGSPRIKGIDKIAEGVRLSCEYFPLKKYKHKTTSQFATSAFPSNIAPQVKAINPDLINIHWVGNGFVRPEELPKLARPVVLTLRDMSHFTGGCYYASSCTRYEAQCGACPQLGSSRSNDLSRRGWLRKHRAFTKTDLTVVGISHWIAECARRSSLLGDYPVQVIANAIDASAYTPVRKSVAREALGLATDKKIILFGALSATSDKRKGWHHLAKALPLFASQHPDLSAEALVFGASQPTQAADLGLNIQFLGRLHDTTMLALVYAAADVMVVPSTEEAFGKTAIEAMACGTPVVAFRSTGLEESVEHQHNGYCAEPFSPEDLAAGISWVLADENRWQRLSQNSRWTVENKFTVEHQAARYLALYTKILSDR